MGRVQRDQRQLSFHHTFDHFFGRLRGNLVVLDMSPPDNHIGFVERFRIKPLFRRLDRDGIDGNSWQLFEMGGNGATEEVFAVRLLLGRLLFVPNEDMDFARFFRGIRAEGPGHRQKKGQGKHRKRVSVLHGVSRGG